MMMSAMELSSLLRTGATILGEREAAGVCVGSARMRATEGWRRCDQMVTGGGRELAGAEADGGARRPDGRGREGGEEGVQEEQKLTRSAMERSGRRGEVASGRNGPRRPSAGVGEDGPIPSNSCSPAGTTHRGGRGEDGGPPENLTGARGGRKRRQAPEFAGGTRLGFRPEGGRRGEDGVA